MENDAHIQHLHTSLFRSKWAIFSIVAFLTLLTYLLITVSGQISTQETMINTAPKANTLMPDEPLPPLTCDSYADYVLTSLRNLDGIKTKLKCPPHPTGTPNNIVPNGGSEECRMLDDAITHISSMKNFMAMMCNRCPMPTAVPGGSGGQLPTPTGPLPTGTPVACIRVGERCSDSLGCCKGAVCAYGFCLRPDRGSLSPTPTPMPRPTSSGPIIPIDPQPTYSPQ
jgi:hypothetical protein